MMRPLDLFYSAILANMWNGLTCQLGTIMFAYMFVQDGRLTAFDNVDDFTRKRGTFANTPVEF